MNPPLPYQNFEEIRKKAYAIRHNYFDGMEKNLLNLESALVKNGMEVMWCKDQESLLGCITEKAEKNEVRRVSFDTRISLGGLLPGRVEEVPVANAENSADDLDILVVDADLAVCDTGSLVFLDKKSQCCFNKVKNMVVIVNIDQCIASQNDLSFMVALKYMSMENKMPKDVKVIRQLPSYVLPSTYSYVSDQMFTQQPMGVTVILYMNGIEDLISSEILKESLYCIHCGRCLEVCPVAALSDNLSPIDLVKMNSLDKYNQSQHIFSHTTLCGACAAACPVGVPLMRLMLAEMQASNLSVKPSRTRQLYALFSRRGKLNKANNPFLKYFFVKRFFGKNRNLSRYFSNQSGDFFNVSYQSPHEDNPNELIKDTDAE